MMKKIAFILQDLTGGGAERTVANLSFELSSKYEFYIIVYNGQNVSYPHKATILDLALPPASSKFGKVLNVFRRINAVKKLKKEYKFDAVVSFMFGANIVNVLSKRDEKIITSARNFMSVYGLSKLKIEKERFVDNRADKVVGISEMVRRDLVKNFGISDDHTVTIYNPCDVERIKKYASEDSAFHFKDKKFYFITIGRLVHQKGQWNLIRAFKEVANECIDAELLILGTGPLERELLTYANTLGIADRISFLGFIENPYAVLSKANVFVLPSLHEGLGNVVLEALACNVPIISTDCFAGPREILAPHSNFEKKATGIEYEEYGVLVPEFDSEMDLSDSITEAQEQLARAMIEMYNSDEIRKKYAEKSMHRINDFSPKTVALQWINLFEELGIR